MGNRAIMKRLNRVQEDFLQESRQLHQGVIEPDAEAV